MNKFADLRKILLSDNLEFIMEAHNALSAKIVEEAHFKAIWASSLTISATLGLRDNNEASWTQVLDVCEFMSDATSIPILMDADSGYGNFNNVRRLIKKVEQRSIAGICIEDKRFPKLNSFIENSDLQELDTVESMCSKIKAAKDTQINTDFTVVARTEAFIFDCPLEEVLRRAELYSAAGADALVIHSKINTVKQIAEFMAEWDKFRCPIIVIPTKYYQTSAAEFKSMEISAVIWANQLLRASINTMQVIASEIKSTKSVASIEKMIAPINEIFRLQNMGELHTAEKKYANIKEFLNDQSKESL